MSQSAGRVAVVFRVEADAVRDAHLSPRLEPMAQALVAAGFEVAPVPYAAGHEAEVGRRLLDVDGVLVWADPLSENGTRAGLDRVLRQAETLGVWVGSRPDVIDRIGTKDVLVTTRNLGWGSDTHRYTDTAQLRLEFPTRLAADGSRVLKATRGNGGRTVWKVSLPAGPAAGGLAVPEMGTEVLVQHARSRDGSVMRMSLAGLFEEVAAAGAFAGWAADGPTATAAGSVVDQEFIPSVTRGIIRCYLVGAAVAGFGRQYPAGVEPDGPLDVVAGTESPPEAVMGLPASKTMYPPDEPAFADLRRLLETDWVPGMANVLGLAADDLPALWDIDLFIANPAKDARGRRFVLCEVNASSVTPSPPVVPAQVARHVFNALARRSR